MEEGRGRWWRIAIVGSAGENRWTTIAKRGSWNVEGRVIILIIAEFAHHPAPNALRKRFSIAVLSSTK